MQPPSQRAVMRRVMETSREKWDRRDASVGWTSPGRGREWLGDQQRHWTALPPWEMQRRRRLFELVDGGKTLWAVREAQTERRSGREGRRCESRTRRWHGGRVRDRRRRTRTRCDVTCRLLPTPHQPPSFRLRFGVIQPRASIGSPPADTRSPCEMEIPLRRIMALCDNLSAGGKFCNTCGGDVVTCLQTAYPKRETEPG